VRSCTKRGPSQKDGLAVSHLQQITVVAVVATDVCPLEQRPISTI